MTTFEVVPGTAVSDILENSREAVIDVVRKTYLAHEDGQTVNPDSYFLRFPDKPSSRVIALPAYVGSDVDLIGIKWISSSPDNVARGVPRASAVLVLNDATTGYPVACLEAARISAARTAASAACAVSVLGRRTETRSFIGAGVIARTICDYLPAVGIRVASATVHDLDKASAEHLVAHAGGRLCVPVRPATGLTEALSADIVLFATTASTPYVPTDTDLHAGQLLLNISLRDLAPELLLAHNNVLDDVEHGLKARTSPHLAEEMSGSRGFVTGTLGQALRGRLQVDPARATIFLPLRPGCARRRRRRVCGGTCGRAR